MQNDNLKFKILSFLPQIIASLFLVGAVVFAWTEPASPPPEGNVPAPLNVGNVGQSKEGWLATLKSILIGSNPSADEQNAVGYLRTTGGAMLGTENPGVGLIVMSGNVGIGTTPSEKLEVWGNIKISADGQIKNFKVENVTTLPSVGSSGRMVFNTSDSKIYFYNGATWESIRGQ